MLLAGLFVGPLLVNSMFDERWPTIALVLLTIWLLLDSPPAYQNIHPALPNWTIFAALALAGTALVVDIDKLLFASGILLFWSGFLIANPNHGSPFRLLIASLLVIPLPSALETEIAIRLSSLETSIFVNAGQLLGFDVYQIGNQIIAKGIAVSINSDCSGSLMFIPCLLGFVAVSAARPMSPGKTFLFIASALPFAFLLNCIRLLLLVAANFNASEGFADAAHDTLGWIFMAFGWLLPVFIWQPENQPDPINRPGSNLTVFAAFIVAVLITTFFRPTASVQPPVQLAIPYYVNQWIGIDQSVDAAEEAILGTEKIVRRLYSDTVSGREILATFILHQNPEKGLEHSSAKCFKALGWAVDKEDHQSIAPGASITRMRVTDHLHSQNVIELSKIIIPPGTHKPVYLRVQIVSQIGAFKDEELNMLDLFERSVVLTTGRDI